MHFKIFGSKCYPTVLNQPKGNHDPKELLGIFVDGKYISLGVMSL